MQRRYDLSAHQVDMLQHLGLGHLRVEQAQGHVGEPHFVVGGDLFDAFLGAAHQEGAGPFLQLVTRAAVMLNVL